MPVCLNDVHSQFNETRVARVERPGSLEELREAVVRAAREGHKISVAGGRHAMGGQQFGTGAVHLDSTGMQQVLGFDAERGLLRIEAGADWPAIIAATQAAGGHWGIRQKQTGVDAVTLGGSISANAHGRGLLLAPLGADIEDLVLVDATGEVRRCSRTENAERFSLALGGYGLFGVIHEATLRLAPRQRLRRLVDIIDLDDAIHAVFRRVADGCVYGDFQFVIDTRDASFLRRGVFATYQPAGEGAPPPDDAADLPSEAWLELLKLAHRDKGAAFQLYSQHYLSTHGRTYWSDTMQLATYLPSYADYLSENALPGPAAERETLLIGEHYVPKERLLEFMAQAREILRRFGAEVIYGTIRAIQRDTDSFLPWAREEYVCVVLNLRTPHTPAGRARTAETFRALIQAALDLGGNYFLTYHRHATAAQVERGYPRFREWLGRKREFDPGELFWSDWYAHYRAAFA